MKRVLLIGLGLVILVLGARAVFRALASDETKIRWRIEQMESGYNEGDVGDTLGPTAQDWTHEGHPFRREDVRGWLIARFFQDRDPETKKLRHRVVIDMDTLEIDVEDDVATFEVGVRFDELVDGEWTPSCELVASGEWRKGPNGWFLRESSHEAVFGTLASI